MLKDLYIKNSQIPLRYLDKNNLALVPSKKDEKAFIELKNVKESIKQFVDSGSNILICSNNCGNGKTSWAVKLLLAYIDEVSNVSFSNNTPALFLNVNSFLGEKKLAINDTKLLDRINGTERSILSSRLVVFDDIADKSLSEYDLNSMYYWIDYRTANMKSCIYTTNQMPDQLQRTLNGKIYSRIVNYSSVIMFTDGDHRRVKLGTTSIT